MAAALEAEIYPISPKGESTLRVSETGWGYVVRSDVDGIRQVLVSLTAMRFVGLVLVLAAYGQWLVPASFFPGEAIVAKALMTFFFGVLGAALYWSGNGRRETEFHVDRTRREMRLALCVSGGIVRFPLVVPLSRVTDVAVSSIDAKGDAGLLVLLKDQEAPLPMIRGNAKVLLGLERRIRADLQSIEDRFARRLAHRVPFKSRRLLLT